MYTYPVVQISNMIVFPLFTSWAFVKPKQDSSLGMAQNGRPPSLLQSEQRNCGSTGIQTQQKCPINGAFFGKSLKMILHCHVITRATAASSDPRAAWYCGFHSRRYCRHLKKSLGWWVAFHWPNMYLYQIYHVYWQEQYMHYVNEYNCFVKMIEKT